MYNALEASNCYLSLDAAPGIPGGADRLNSTTMEKLSTLIQKAKAVSDANQGQCRPCFFIDYDAARSYISILFYPDGRVQPKANAVPIPRSIAYRSFISTPHLLNEACRFLEDNLK